MKLMMRNILMTIVLSISFTGFGQQQFTFTDYLLNEYYYNPAIAGSKDYHQIDFSYRNQWLGFEGSPVSVQGSYYGSIKNLQKHGYGFTLISDKTGLTRNTAAYANYAHHFKLNEKIKLGIGVRPGFMQYSIDLYNAKLADQGDEVLTGNIFTANALDLNGGIHLYGKNWFYTAAAYHMLGESISFTDYNGSLSKHFAMFAGYKFENEKKKMSYQPIMMLRKVNPLPVQYGVMLKAYYQNQIWLGVSFRSQDAIGFSLGTQLKKRFSVGYSYDYSISNIQAYQSGSHQLMLSFITTSKKPSLDEQDEDLNNSIFDDNKKGIEEEEEE